LEAGDPVQQVVLTGVHAQHEDGGDVVVVSAPCSTPRMVVVPRLAQRTLAPARNGGRSSCGRRSIPPETERSLLLRADAWGGAPLGSCGS
jgi:hypothetical protein